MLRKGLIRAAAVDLLAFGGRPRVPDFMAPSGPPGPRWRGSIPHLSVSFACNTPSPTSCSPAGTAQADGPSALDLARRALESVALREPPSLFATAKILLYRPFLNPPVRPPPHSSRNPWTTKGPSIIYPSAPPPGPSVRSRSRMPPRRAGRGGGQDSSRSRSSRVSPNPPTEVKRTPALSPDMGPP